MMGDTTTGDTTNDDTTPSYETDPYSLAYPETRPFWEAAAQGRLTLKVCQDCHRAYWYPRPICPLCGSARTEWQAASGRGTLYAFSEMRKADKPYVLAYVELEEGPRLMTNIVDARFDELSIGMAVQVKFRQADEGRSIPVFAPVQ